MRLTAPLLITLCATLLILQFFVRPAVGIAGNGDFGKMAGPLALGPEEGNWVSTRFDGFRYKYIQADRYRYNDGWSAQFISSELLVVKLARGLQRIVQKGPRFDIRWMGAVHGLLLLIGVGMWICALKGRWRVLVGLWVILVWTDLAYVQYLNSFYMDTIAIVSLVVCAAAGLHIVQDRDSTLWAGVMVCAAALFAGSKSQHAIPALLLIPLFVFLGLQTRNRIARRVWLTGTLVLLLIVGLLIQRTSDNYKRQAVFDIVFMRIVPEAADPLRTLHELGLQSQDLRYMGMYAFMPNAPLGNEDWARNFSLRCNHGLIMRYYLRHPSVAVDFLSRAVAGEAPNMRPFGNRSPEDGFPADTRAKQFAYWSDFRSYLLHRAPWHVLLLALITLGAAGWLLLHSPADRAFAGLVLVMQGIAIVECGIGSLADSEETFRHLLLFNAATDVTILLLPLLISRVYAGFPAFHRRGHFRASMYRTSPPEGTPA
jgi:hypothetical protein